MISRFIPFVEKEAPLENKRGGGSVVTENPKGGIAEIFGRIQRGTTQIRLENEDKRGGGGSRKSSKVIREDHFSEVTFKGYSLI